MRNILRVLLGKWQRNGKSTKKSQDPSPADRGAGSSNGQQPAKPQAARGSRRLPNDNHATASGVVTESAGNAEQIAPWLEMLAANEARFGPSKSQADLARRLRRETSDYLTKHLPHRSRGNNDRPREIEHPLKTKSVSPVRPHWPTPPSVK